MYVVSTTALSFLIGWIYNGTGGSLLLAILAHTASDVADNLRVAALGPSTFGGELLLTGVVVAAAVTVLVLTRGTLATDRSVESTVVDQGPTGEGTIGPVVIGVRRDVE